MRKKPSVVLGISFGHGDSSAALIVEGCLLAAAEEERFTRIKHDASFPTHSIKYCLSKASLEPSAIEVVAVARKPWNAMSKRLLLYAKHPALFSHRNKYRGAPQVKTPSLKVELAQVGITNAKIRRVEHHLAHMFSARFMTDAEHVALLSFDGLGDFVSTAIGKSVGNEITILDRVHFPHSVGYFYTAMTQYLGFPYFGDEFKVMGLSSYGEPAYLRQMQELIRTRDDRFGFSLNLEAFPILKHPMKFYIKDKQPYVEPFSNNNFIRTLVGIPPRKPHEPLTDVHRNLAKSVQVRFEQIATYLTNSLHQKVGGDVLALAGGCAHNSVWAGKIRTETPFKEVVIAPASHDAGIAVGAAAAACEVAIVPNGKHWGLLGPSHQELPSLSTEALPEGIFKNQFSREEDLIHWMVDQLTRGNILGLYNGRMEFGPRALGSRSIIADPRNSSMRDRLNQRVKHRETFRPFAASVLFEEQENWFVGPYFCPNMEAVFPVRTEKKEKISAVVHADGSCRIQSVMEETQPFYYRLIRAFFKKTGIPMIINTSFNDSEPIVCSPNDAWRCFLNTEMDGIVIGYDVFYRTAISARKAG